MFLLRMPGFAVDNGAEALRVFDLHFDRGLALPFSETEYDIIAAAFHLKYDFCLEFFVLLGKQLANVHVFRSGTHDGGGDRCTIRAHVSARPVVLSRLLCSLCSWN